MGDVAHIEGALTNAAALYVRLLPVLASKRTDGFRPGPAINGRGSAGQFILLVSNWMGCASTPRAAQYAANYVSGASARGAGRLRR